MMVSDPGKYVDTIAAAGADLYFFHVEAEPFPLRLIDRVCEAGMVPGIAINPSTPVAHLRDIDVPYVLVMTVEPGFAGQRWASPSGERIRRLRAAVGDHVVIGVDGNVSRERAQEAQGAGATLFVCGTSALFTEDHDYATAVRLMRDALTT
jgi:ribulose-phosphate 3-epimerase